MFGVDEIRRASLEGKMARCTIAKLCPTVCESPVLSVPHFTHHGPSPELAIHVDSAFYPFPSATTDQLPASMEYFSEPATVGFN